VVRKASGRVEDQTRLISQGSLPSTVSRTQTRKIISSRAAYLLSQAVKKSKRSSGSQLPLGFVRSERFLEIADDDLPDRVLEALRARGIDPAAAGLDRDILGALRDTRTREPIGPVAQPVQPQAHRRACKARLNDRSRVLAARICAATGLPPLAASSRPLASAARPTTSRPSSSW
jgi:hypothetical protein